MSYPTDASDYIFPPLLTGTHAVQRVVTGAAAVRAAISGPTTAKCMVTFFALTSDAYVAFKVGTAAATVTAATGYLIPAGAERTFLIDPAIANDVEAIAPAGAGVLQWYVSSPLYQGQS